MSTPSPQANRPAAAVVSPILADHLVVPNEAAERGSISETLNALAGAAALCAMAGCVKKQPVSQLGPDTLDVSASVGAAGGVGGAAFDPAGGGMADVAFRCLKVGDPMLDRPSYQQAPNVVIENRSR